MAVRVGVSCNCDCSCCKPERPFGLGIRRPSCAFIGLHHFRDSSARLAELNFIAARARFLFCTVIPVSGDDFRLNQAAIPGRAAVRRVPSRARRGRFRSSNAASHQRSDAIHTAALPPRVERGGLLAAAWSPPTFRDPRRQRASTPRRLCRSASHRRECNDP